MAQERILLLYLRTGGGHIAAARAIERRIRTLHSEEEVEVIALDAMPPTSVFWDGLFQEGYRFTSNRFRQLWVGAIEITRIKFIRDLWNLIMTAVFWKRIADAIEKHDITKVVFLHCLLIAPGLFAAKHLHREPEMVTVVLDPFTVPEFWFQRTGGPIVVFSERARRDAIKRFHRLPSLVHHYPIILREEFSHPLADKRIRQLKKELSFNPNKRIVLLAGGGEGLPHGERYTEQLLRSDLDVEIAVVAGKDEAMRQNLERIALRYPQKQVHIYGFVNHMFELMNIADIVIAKGGPATVMEALMLRKPLIVFQYLYGQEKGNVEFVRNNRVGFYIEDPQKIVDHISAMVSDPSVYEDYRGRIDRLRLRNGTNEIVDFILSYKRPQPRRAGYPISLREVMFSAEGRRDPVKQLLGYMAARFGFELGLRRRKA